MDRILELKCMPLRDGKTVRLELKIGDEIVITALLDRHQRMDLIELVCGTPQTMSVPCNREMKCC